ncbi:MAG: YfbK domain-containing protein [Verrucomicrobiia bacterium]
MNFDNPTPREEQEALVVALLLGELDGELAAEVQGLIDADPELAAFQERMAKTINIVSAAAHPDNDGERLSLSDERREVVLNTIKEPAKIETATTPRVGWKNYWNLPLKIAAAFAIALFIAGLVIPKFAGRTKMARREAYEEQLGLYAMETGSAVSAALAPGEARDAMSAALEQAQGGRQMLRDVEASPPAPQDQARSKSGSQSFGFAEESDASPEIPNYLWSRQADFADLPKPADSADSFRSSLSAAMNQKNQQNLAAATAIPAREKTDVSLSIQGQTSAAKGMRWGAERDERVIIGGAFTSVNGTDRDRIARLKVDGTLDVSNSLQPQNTTWQDSDSDGYSAQFAQATPSQKRDEQRRQTISFESLSSDAVAPQAPTAAPLFKSGSGNTRRYFAYTSGKKADHKFFRSGGAARSATDKWGEPARPNVGGAVAPTSGSKVRLARRADDVSAREYLFRKQPAAPGQNAAEFTPSEPTEEAQRRSVRFARSKPKSTSAPQPQSAPVRIATGLTDDLATVALQAVEQGLSESIVPQEANVVLIDEDQVSNLKLLKTASQIPAIRDGEELDSVAIAAKSEAVGGVALNFASQLPASDSKRLLRERFEQESESKGRSFAAVDLPTPPVDGTARRNWSIPQSAHEQALGFDANGVTFAGVVDQRSSRGRAVGAQGGGGGTVNPAKDSLGREQIAKRQAGQAPEGTAVLSFGLRGGQAGGMGGGNTGSGIAVSPKPAADPFGRSANSPGAAGQAPTKREIKAKFTKSNPRGYATFGDDLGGAMNLANTTRGIQNTDFGVDVEFSNREAMPASPARLGEISPPTITVASTLAEVTEQDNRGFGLGPKSSQPAASAGSVQMPLPKARAVRPSLAYERQGVSDFGRSGVASPAPPAMPQPAPAGFALAQVADGRQFGDGEKLSRDENQRGNLAADNGRMVAPLGEAELEQRFDGETKKIEEARRKISQLWDSDSESAREASGMRGTRVRSAKVATTGERELSGPRVTVVSGRQSSFDVSDLTTTITQVTVGPVAVGVRDTGIELESLRKKKLSVAKSRSQRGSGKAGALLGAEMAKSGQAAFFDDVTNSDFIIPPIALVQANPQAVQKQLQDIMSDGLTSAEKPAEARYPHLVDIKSTNLSIENPEFGFDAPNVITLRRTNGSVGIATANFVTAVPLFGKLFKSTTEQNGRIAKLEKRINELSELEDESRTSKIAGNPPVDVKKKASKPNSELSIASKKLKRLAPKLDTKLAVLDEQGEVAEDKPAPPKPKPALTPKPEIQTKANAFSTFSLNVSDVAFKLSQASLANGKMPQPGTIRSEEFLNAMDYHDPAPAPGDKIAFAWDRVANPFAHNRDFVRFSIQTAAQGRTSGQPLNLVVLLDNSGSMERADRVEIVREALSVLAGQLTPQDKISVIAFARTPRLWVDGMPGGKGDELLRRIMNLQPEGGTNLELALEDAYAIANRHFMKNGNNRVIVLTDGAANLGNVDPKVLKQRVEEQRRRNIALDCFGIGWEGYNDDLLEELSRNGDGRYGFINTPREARTGFAGQLAGALQVAASNVKAQIEFNPDRVTSYRQIGYDKHQLTKEQFRDNKVDAAEIGAAEAGTAMYALDINRLGKGPIATVRVRFKVPATGVYEEIEWEIPYNPINTPLDQAKPAMRLAAVAVTFAEWLAESPFAGSVTPGDLQKYLAGVSQHFSADARPKQLVEMIRQARRLSGK